MDVVDNLDAMATSQLAALYKRGKRAAEELRKMDVQAVQQGGTTPAQLQESVGTWIGFVAEGQAPALTDVFASLAATLTMTPEVATEPDIVASAGIAVLYMAYGAAVDLFEVTYLAHKELLTQMEARGRASESILLKRNELL